MSLPRRIELEGPLNFRDLGGYPTADGTQRVRWRRLFRSDALHRVSDADAEEIVQRLGLTTIVDLRTDDELTQTGRGPLEHTGLDYHHVPILDATREVTDLTIVEAYELMIGERGGPIARAVEVLAAGQGHPVVFHCAAGKDRTGLVAAVVLDLLGVAEPDIVEDYVLTNEVIPAMLTRWRAMAVEAGRTIDERVERFMQAPAEAIAAALRVVRERFGGPEEYVAVHGVSGDVVDALRRGLLEPV